MATKIYFASEYSYELAQSVDALREMDVETFASATDPLGLCDTCYQTETDDPAGLIEDLQSELVLRVSDYVPDEVQTHRMTLHGKTNEQIRCELW